VRSHDRALDERDRVVVAVAVGTLAEPPDVGRRKDRQKVRLAVEDLEAATLAARKRIDAQYRLAIYAFLNARATLRVAAKKRF
jgi:hypothetical protein